MTSSPGEGFALINRVGAHGVEVVTSSGAHFCIPRREWDRMLTEAWAEVFDRWVLYGEGHADRHEVGQRRPDQTA